MIGVIYEFKGCLYIISFGDFGSNHVKQFLVESLFFVA